MSTPSHDNGLRVTQVSKWSALPSLPILAIAQELDETLNQHHAAVLEAPTGAGKSTLVPLILYTAGWLREQRLVMLEPRRLAARAVATRMAHILGEAVGQTVGYRMRLDTKIGRDTRIEVVTEGILGRMLNDDPALEGVGLVIFDEFHERSLSADLGLALCLDAQKNIRSDLRLLVMSATLDGESVARLMGHAPRITSSGRAFPVEVRYAKRRPENLDREVAATVRRALTEDTGDILVFLPGAAEIHRLHRNLTETQLPPCTAVLPLFGDLSQSQQDLALATPAAGHRKIILATSIAETSLTIEGVRIVVDSGVSRRPRFDPASGMSRLDTMAVSLASAEQRRGRAGRVEAGVCYRVYTQASERELLASTPPEILETDLSPLALELACWGTQANALSWLDPPPPAHLSQANDLLKLLGALDTTGRVTAAGQTMARMGMHPRLSRMLMAARGPAKALAAQLAALLSDRDLVKGQSGNRDSDLGKRVDLLNGHAVVGLEADRSTLERVRRLSSTWQRASVMPDALSVAPAIAVPDIGLLLACAYPDRVARRRAETNRYVLANGRGATFQTVDSLSQQEFLVIATVDGGDRDARIQLAAALDKSLLLKHFKESIIVKDRIEWDRRQSAVVAKRERCFGELVLEDSALTGISASATVEAMLAGIAEMGLNCLPWTSTATSFRDRVLFLRTIDTESGTVTWPDLSDAALMDTLADWLSPYLEGISRRDHLSKLNLTNILKNNLDYAQQKLLDKLAPTHLTVPSGSQIPIDYTADGPMVSVRLQELFGLHTTPLIAGKAPLTIELLSPARRPVQVTRDLSSFWNRGYVEVKKELKGRYPKHYWPDNPLVAQATARVKPRR